ncbi:MAG: type II secretion system protein, partial [Patescibacteria group bacterium]
QGFSLLEIVIATAIFGLVAVISLSSVTTFTKADNRTKYKRDAIDTYQNIYQIISRELWSAKSIDDISNTKVEYTDASGAKQALEIKDNKITLTNMVAPQTIKMQADNVDIVASFSGKTSVSSSVQPYVVVNISKISVKNPKNSIVEDELTGDDMGFTKVLRIR